MFVFLQGWNRVSNFLQLGKQQMRLFNTVGQNILHMYRTGLTTYWQRCSCTHLTHKQMLQHTLIYSLLYNTFLQCSPCSCLSSSEETIVSHTPFVPSHAKVSASRLITYQNTRSQSIRPSVHVGCRDWAPCQTPPNTHLLSWLLIGWLSALLLVCLCVWKCFSLLNHGDGALKASWLVEGCQVEQMGGDWVLPEETNY